VEDEATRAVTGLVEYRLLDAVEVDGVLELTVEVGRDEAACPRCGVFSRRVKQRSVQRVRDGLSFERPTMLVWRKRRFRCDTPGCQATFADGLRLTSPRRVHREMTQGWLSPRPR